MRPTLLALLGTCALPCAVRAADCALVESRSSLAELSGARIASVSVVTDGPELPGPARAFASLHPVTREGTLTRQLLFAPGDTVDTLLVGETMRRLRRLKLFSDAILVARRCDGSDDLTLTLMTRDSWTLRPTARFRPPASLSIGMEERNLFGSGRALSVTSEITPTSRGAAVAITDPWLFGSDIAGNLRIASIGGARTVRAGLRNHEYSVFDDWRIETSVSRVLFADTAAGERGLHSLNGLALVGRRIGDAPTGATMLLLGVELDSASNISPTRRTTDPDAPHGRSFVGLDVGILRRTAQFDTASWFVHGRGFLDVPLGWEGEAVLSAGWSREARVPALHADGWLGRMWMPARGQLVLTDLWTSGYAGRDLDANFIARASASWYGETWGGMWSARVMAERLLELDPDLRQLSLMPMADHTAWVVRPYGARASRALGTSLDRSVRLLQVAPSSVLDVGAFVAASWRSGVAELPGGDLRAAVVGARARVLSVNGGVSSVRVDVGYPVALSDALGPRRVYGALVIGTLFDVSRTRDWRRLY